MVQIMGIAKPPEKTCILDAEAAHSSLIPRNPCTKIPKPDFAAAMWFRLRAVNSQFLFAFLASPE
jgi:hypothetical protein